MGRLILARLLEDLLARRVSGPDVATDDLDAHHSRSPLDWSGWMTSTRPSAKTMLPGRRPCPQQEATVRMPSGLCFDGTEGRSDSCSALTTGAIQRSQWTPGGDDDHCGLFATGVVQVVTHRTHASRPKVTSASRTKSPGRCEARSSMRGPRRQLRAGLERRGSSVRGSSRPALFRGKPGERRSASGGFSWRSLTRVGELLPGATKATDSAWPSGIRLSRPDSYERGSQDSNLESPVLETGALSSLATAP